MKNRSVILIFAVTFLAAGVFFTQRFISDQASQKPNPENKQNQNSKYGKSSKIVEKSFGEKDETLNAITHASQTQAGSSELNRRNIVLAFQDSVKEWERTSVKLLSAVPSHFGGDDVMFLMSPPPPPELLQELDAEIAETGISKREARGFRKEILGQLRLSVGKYRFLAFSAHPTDKNSDSVAVFYTDSSEDLRINPISGNVTIVSETGGVSRISDAVAKRFDHLYRIVEEDAGDGSVASESMGDESEITNGK